MIHGRWHVLGLALALAALSSACSINAAKIAEALSKSDRSWCLTANGYGENVKISGSGLQSGTMRCGDDGMSLSSAAPAPVLLDIPLRLNPQLSVGPSTLAAPPPPLPMHPPSPRVTPQGGPVPPREGLLQIGWTPLPADPAPSPLSADVRLLLYNIGDLHGLAPGK